MSTAMVLCRIVHFSLILLLVGGWLFKPLLWRRVATPVDALQARVAPWFAGVALLSGIAWLLLVAASMAGDNAAAFDPGTLGLVLGKTFFGEVWRWHLLVNALLLALLLSPWRGHAPLQIGLGGLLLITLAPVGHGAMLDGLAGQLLILNQAVHLLCVSLWLGGLLLLLMLMARPTDSPIAPILRRFSGIGYLLVAGLLLTGMINVRVLTGTFWPTPLFEGFALVLLIKAGIVLLMLGLALFNRLRIDGADQRLASLRASVLLEWLLGLGAVAAVSILGTLPPMIA